MQVVSFERQLQTIYKSQFIQKNMRNIVYQKWCVLTEQFKFCLQTSMFFNNNRNISPMIGQSSTLIQCSNINGDILKRFRYIKFYKYMINLSWDIYDGITNRAQCAEILARSFLQNDNLSQQLKINKQEAIEFYQEQLDNKSYGWVFIFYLAELNNEGTKQIIGVACANDMHDFLQYYDEFQKDGIQNNFFLKQNAFYALWAKEKKAKKNEFFYMGDIAISLDSINRETVFYMMMVQITQYFQSCGFIYGIVKGLKPIKNEILNINDVIAIPETSEINKTQGKKQILYAGKTEFLLNTFQKLLIQGQPKL
ncbi:hypothetical protein pb186bvf_010542 [Paramecium bursaria]